MNDTGGQMMDSSGFSIPGELFAGSVSSIVATAVSWSTCSVDPKALVETEGATSPLGRTSSSIERAGEQGTEKVPWFCADYEDGSRSEREWYTKG